MIPQTLPDFPARTRLFDVSATVRGRCGGGGGRDICGVRACARACAFFKVVVWFCSVLTRAPEVIRIQTRRNSSPSVTPAVSPRVRCSHSNESTRGYEKKKGKGEKKNP